AAAHRHQPPTLGTPLHRTAQGAPRVRLRHLRADRALEPAHLCPPAPVRGRSDAVRAQPGALGPGGRTRPERVRGALSDRDVRSLALPADRRVALPTDTRAARILLVRAGGRR